MITSNIPLSICHELSPSDFPILLLLLRPSANDAVTAFLICMVMQISSIPSLSLALVVPPHSMNLCQGTVVQYSITESNLDIFPQTNVR